jgi:hypothetical protein
MAGYKMWGAGWMPVMRKAVASVQVWLLCGGPRRGAVRNLTSGRGVQRWRGGEGGGVCSVCMCVCVCNCVCMYVSA